MRKFANVATLAVVAIGFSAIVGGSAIAASPRYTNDQAYEAQLARQNDNATTEQSFRIDPIGVTDNTLDSHPNQAHAPTHQSNGNN